MSQRFLVVRLGAMGDVLHALPAVSTLKRSFPRSFVAWAVEEKWLPLLEDNPYVDELIPVVRRTFGSLLALRRKLRSLRFDCAIDMQGLIKSALVASAARPERIYGFHRSQAREALAALVYSDSVRTRSVHVVDKGLELVRAAGATVTALESPIPEGQPEGELPEARFVLANPLAGWPGKQWPLERYAELGGRLWRECNVELVLNGAERIEATGTVSHVSGLRGLIYATRRAAAVVGLDSGPMHLAAALGKPGVALFGPTDPARNGPYGGSFQVIRAPGATTSYKRRNEIDPSMAAITVDEVFRTLAAQL
jgi:heptosyltransferase-1